MEEIAKVFYRENKCLFNSKLDKFDRLGELGEKRNEFFKINYLKFQKYFLKIYKKKKSKMNLLKVFIWLTLLQIMKTIKEKNYFASSTSYSQNL